MPRTPSNLVRHELIGLKVEVVESTDPKKKGIKGRVVNETRDTLIIEERGKEKVIPKKEAKFLFTLPNGQKVEIIGKLLIGRPEDRIKKKFRKGWIRNFIW